MGWFGVLETSREEAFRILFCQKEYKKDFELLWEKHMKDRSIAIYTLNGKCIGETILWAEKNGEIMYKPVSWTDSLEHIPKKWVNKLLENSSDFEKECYEEFAQKKKLKDLINPGTVVKLNSTVTFDNGGIDDTFKYFGHGKAWACNIKAYVSGITKDFIVEKGFKVIVE